MTTTPFGATELVSAQAIPETTVNENQRLTEAGACHFVVADNDLTAPPGSCADGARYIIAATATGAWAGLETQIAVAVGTNAANGWLYIVPKEGYSAYIQDENIRQIFDGAAWVADTTGGSGTVTTVSVVSANGLAGSVANATTTPAITLSTSITGVLKGNGTAISAAAAGTDYYAPGGTDVAVADGGTGASTAAGARANLGITRLLSPAILGTALTSSEVFAAFTPPSGETWTFPADFSGASGKKLTGGTNPAASYAIDVSKNGSTVGTITISTGGVVSFATAGGTSFTVTAGDELRFIGPSTTDTAVGYAFAIPFNY